MSGLNPALMKSGKPDRERDARKKKPPRSTGAAARH
jgi:hypothetical protein